MNRRDFFLGAALSTTGLAFGNDSQKDNPRSFILLETFYAENKDKRDKLAQKFDSELIPLRHEIGFNKVGIFTLHDELMKNEKDASLAKFNSAVFVLQGTDSADLLLNYQDYSMRKASLFNLVDDLDFIDEEIVAMRAFPSVPEITAPYDNAERILQLRTYNSPNYDRNAMKEAMFEEGELDLFKNSGMLPVFFGKTLIGSMAPNITYMLSFPNNAARVEGWKKFVQSDGWKKMSSDPRYARTATRIRNLFLKPTQNSEI